MGEQDLKRRLAEAARQACENAGISGLCEEGRWECALDAIRSLDIEAVNAALPRN